MHLLGFTLTKGLKYKQVGMVHFSEEKYIYLNPLGIIGSSKFAALKIYRTAFWGYNTAITLF